jgi:hypothetical protein
MYNRSSGGHHQAGIKGKRGEDVVLFDFVMLCFVFFLAALGINWYEQTVKEELHVGNDGVERVLKGMDKDGARNGLFIGVRVVERHVLND